MFFLRKAVSKDLSTTIFELLFRVLGLPEMQSQKVQKSIRNEVPEGPKWSQNGSLEPSGRPSGGDPPPGGSPEASRSGPGRPQGAKMNSWPRPGAAKADFGDQ